MHNWLQFLAVCHMLFSTAWETLLVPMFPNQLQTWKRETASNFTSLLLFRCSPLLTPQKLCRSPNEGMRRVKEICSHFDVKLIINAQLFYFICIGNIATLRLKRKKKKKEFGSSCSAAAGRRLLSNSREGCERGGCGSQAEEQAWQFWEEEQAWQFSECQASRATSHHRNPAALFYVSHCPWGPTLLCVVSLRPLCNRVCVSITDPRRQLVLLTNVIGYLQQESAWNGKSKEIQFQAWGFKRPQEGKREFSEGRCFLEREGDASNEGDAIFMLMLTG